MPPLINLTGKKFGRLIVIERTGTADGGCALWLCLCNCKYKNKITVRSSSLISGNTKSCGCFKKDKMTKHGHCKDRKQSRIYNIWRSMIQRCSDPNHMYYCNYGGRGIEVCKCWKKFEKFLKDMGGPPTNKHSIGRINNDKNYYKSNCQWETEEQQNQNKRNNLFLIYKGKKQLIIKWAKKYRIHYDTLWKRLYIYGWSTERALTTRVRKWRKKK